MLAMILVFLAGMIVMDLMWAWRLGLVQTAYQFIKWKFTKRPQPNFDQE
jgi:hypothetical protein